MTDTAADTAAAPDAGFRKHDARTLPVGTIVRTDNAPHLARAGETTAMLTREDRPGRCPWRSGRGVYVATWRVQLLINDGATVTKPASVGVKRVRK